MQVFAGVEVTTILVPVLREQRRFYNLVSRLSSHSNTDELE
jgi:hypothetical protein